jgi:uncharacterized RDD family membrane protein YckC
MLIEARWNWEYAGFGDRLVADLIDGIVLLLVALPAYVVDRVVFNLNTGLFDEGEDFGATDAVMVCWFLFHLTYLVGTRGQSWGRKLVGIKVVGTDGAPIGFWRALFRNLFAAALSAPPLYLGFLWVIWDPDKQAWHDKVFGTYVIQD